VISFTLRNTVILDCKTNMFGAIELAQTIQNSLNAGHIVIPDGHTTALVIHGDSETKEVTATVARKLGERWKIEGIFDWGIDKGIKAGFNVEWSR
jgi:hypothetical protein